MSNKRKVVAGNGKEENTILICVKYQRGTNGSVYYFTTDKIQVPQWGDSYGT
jgi:hypothetical protein